MANANDTSPAKTKEFLGTLPFRSRQRDYPEAHLDVSLWRCSWNVCENEGRSPCDTLAHIYYGSAEDEVTKFCPRHFFEMHYGPDAPYELVDAAPSAADFPGVGFKEAALRVVLSGCGDVDNEDERQAAQNFAVMAMCPTDVDRDGRGPGKIIADLVQFNDAEKFADLFAAAPDMRKASQKLYDALQAYLIDVPDRDLPNDLVEGMNDMEAAWHKADGTVSEEN